jgi:alcohol dehydrogenase class IV
MIGAFQHLTRTKVVFAPDDLEPLAAEVDAAGRHAVLVCGTTVRRSAAFELVEKALGERIVAVFDAVVPHSSPEIVAAGVELLRDTRPDLVVSLGGGSAIDTAKAMILLHAEGGTLEEHRVRFTPPNTIVYRTYTRPMLPHVAVPTTLSGAEINAGGGIRVPGSPVKHVFAAPALSPVAAVLAPRLSTELPAAITAGTGMNCLAHGIEALYSRHRQPIADALALASVRQLANWLPRAVSSPDDVCARGHLLIASAMAGLALTNTKVCVHHAMCHAVGARYGVPHGLANAIMLPHAMAFNATVAAEPLGRVAGALGAGTDAAAAIVGVRRLAVRLGMPRRLRDLGVPREDLGELAAHAFLDRDVYYNPRSIARAEEIRMIYEAAW